MIGALGLALSIAGAGSALIGAIAALAALRGRRTTDGAIRGAWFTFAALGAANVMMVVALVGRDFSVAYVAEVGSRATPLPFTIASLWGALEGSILFWAGLLAGATVLAVVRTGGADRGRLAGALAVLLGLTAFFALIVAGPGSPWDRVSPVPLDGPGPNPLLQDHLLMIVHPPLLYLGFVGLAVPFAFTVDALVRGRLDDGWLRLARRWTLGPWVFLTLGLLTGAWWSYAVLGWGGYWAWDPVENVALLPWLTATAFLHSAMVGRRGGLLLSWNVVLVAASFALTLFATLVTRSGVLESVHAFTQSAIGPIFVGLLGAVVVGTIGLLAFRLPESTDGRLGARARGFLLNNLLFTAIAITVLIGTIFPLVAETATSTRLSVGAPYFERLVGPLAVGLLILVGVGPSLPWGEWTPRSRATLVPGAAAAGVTATALAATGTAPAGVAAAAAAVFALWQALSHLVARLHRPTRRPGVPSRFPPLSSRAVGGLVSHAGFALLAIAILASAAGKRETVVILEPGASTEVLGQTIAYAGSQERPGANRTVIAAQLTVDGAGISPALNLFSTSTQAIATPAILAGPFADLYVTLLDLDPAGGAATLRVGIHPMVTWIWVAGGLVAIGGVLALASVPLARRPASSTTAAHGGAVLPAQPEAAVDAAGR